MAALDRFVIFSTGGAVLWSVSFVPSPSAADSSLCALVADVVLGARSDSSDAAPLSFLTTGGAVTVRCLHTHATGIIFAAVLGTSMVARAPYIETLLRSVRDAFIAKFSAAGATRAVELGVGGEPGATGVGLAALAAADDGAISFDDDFDSLCTEAENPSTAVTSVAPQKSQHRVAAKTPQYDALERFAMLPDVPAMPPPSQLPVLPPRGGDLSSSAAVTVASSATAPASSMKPLDRLKALGKVSGKKGAAAGGAGGKPTSLEPDSSATRLLDFKYSASAAALLDRSKPSTLVHEAGGGAAATVKYFGTSRAGADLDDSSRGAPPSTGSWLSSPSLSSLMSSLSAPRRLVHDDIVRLVDDLRLHLTEANIADEVAREITASVSESLLGTEVGGGEAGVYAAVNRALHDTLTRVLTPRAPPDLVRGAREKIESFEAKHVPIGERAPYVVVFCGVNGVGKSTTLAKIAFMLKDAQLSVSIAACDSFRAGAVEQLKTHSRTLGVPLFEQGYEKNPVDIAAAAIKAARSAGTQVVLVDTAGRMQNNKQLMAQLARLIGANAPDAVLFVGEALVGSDGVDQLLCFDRALAEHAVDSQRPRRIDGLVLTKFDTVDDKVGAAVSMVYKTGVPVAFVGVGQTYADLRRLNVEAVVNKIMR